MSAHAPLPPSDNGVPSHIGAEPINETSSTKATVKKTLIDEVKDLLPEIDFDGIETVVGSREHMQTRLDSMDKSIVALTETLGETVKLYQEAKSEAKILKEHHLTSIATSTKATTDVGETMMKMLTIDYERLALVLNGVGIIDKKALIETLEKSIEKTSKMDKFAQVVADKIEHEIDYDDLAGEIDYTDLGSYIDFDPTDYWDSSDLAYHFDASDIAEYIDLDNVAQDVANNLNPSNIADHIDTGAITEHIDTEEVASHIIRVEIANHIDTAEVASHIDTEMISEHLLELLNIDILAEKVKELIEEKEGK